MTKSSSLVSEKVRRYRKINKLTLTELSQLSGVSRSYIHEIETNPDKQVSAEKLRCIGISLGVSLSFLLDKSSNTPTQEQQDEAFYDGYLSLSPKNRQLLRSIAELL